MIGKAIKKLRLDREMTQAALAEIMRVRRTAIIQIEKNKQEVYAHQLKYLCKALNVSADDLLFCKKYERLENK